MHVHVLSSRFLSNQQLLKNNQMYEIQSFFFFSNVKILPCIRDVVMTRSITYFGNVITKHVNY